MSLFGFGKKKETKDEKESCCSGVCNGSSESESMETTKKDTIKGAAVKVLGSGCAKCNELEANVKNALTQLGMDTTIEHVTDFAQIAAYGVMSTPALVVDGNVVSYGKVLKVEEVIDIMKKVR